MTRLYFPTLKLSRQAKKTEIKPDKMKNRKLHCEKQKQFKLWFALFRRLCKTHEVNQRY